ncbi:MAG: hypothetical protein H8E66_32505 [Planctomycetes bacterium]|jgi:hypothetical protein|nr:hypothetical protein [Planctomycetota bacterium]
MIAQLLTCLAIVSAPPQSPQLTISDGEVQPQPAGSDVAIVTSPVFHKSLRQWIAHRENQGHRITIVSNQGSLAEIRGRLRQVAAAKRLRWVLLVGDTIGAEGRALRTETQVPTAYAVATLLPKFGGPPHIATDNAYADLNDDGIPEVAVGRITADGPEELSGIVERIFHYETQHRGSWRTRVNLIAGVGGFGKIADFVLESATKRFLTNEIPPGYMTSMTYGSWRSPYCPDPQKFHATTLDRFNEGCLFWVYIGHGHRRYLDKVRVPGGEFHIMDVNDTGKLQSRNGQPIAIFLACNTGAFDNEQDCLAEEMLRSPGGAVAVLAGSRVTMPYAMSVMGDGMIRRYFHSQDATLGEIVLGAKQQMLQKKDAAKEADDKSFNRQLLDSLAATFSPSKGSLETELREHVYLFNLLGDPLLRVQRPQAINVQAPEQQVAGTQCQLLLHSPIDGKARVELVCRRDLFKTTVSSRGKFELTDESRNEMQRTYQAANDRVWTHGMVDLTTGDNTFRLAIPENATGPCYVRVYAHNQQGDAIGATSLFIARP